ncbi:MAG: hypothetical protein OXJ90_08205 [Spirochaetaceae bacterium]|nr:hypothetical protein [Spirochaetaceae bacterium]
MNLQRGSGWMRRGLSLLWEADALFKVVSSAGVVSLRGLFAMSSSWPDELPGAGGDALVVAGVEGCLDALGDDDGSTWLETDLKRIILSFQDEYQGLAALILWLPSGRRRVTMSPATEEYSWKNAASRPARALPIGRCLWAGADSDAARIIVSDGPTPDHDGPAWVGLHHPRIS